MPYFYSEPASLLNYLDEMDWSVLDEPGEVAMCGTSWKKQAVHCAIRASSPGMLPPDYPLPYITWDEWAICSPATKR